MSKVTGDGSIFLTEKAAADADVAGDGQIWVETATPNVLKFTDDAGQDFDISQPTTLATEQATTSGTSIDFTGIPSGVKKITIMFVGVSHDGTSDYLVQLGDAGGIEATSYLSTVWWQVSASNSLAVDTAGFGLTGSVDSNTTIHGTLHLHLEDSANFTWVASGVLMTNDTTRLMNSAGSKSLSAELTQIRITSVSADTFDAGAINIQYSF